ncbi:MAG: type II toxin-antitoxin system CcdA family antitoxin [Sphingomonadaceae bacterium]|nr:type II toxin-antitoxin system CcdA family antitoxin [Sphingomonadaceae bacterium]
MLITYAHKLGASIVNAISHKPKSPRGKTATNKSLNAAMLAEAKGLGIDISQTCESGLARELKSVREARWKSENRASIQAWNEWTEKQGIRVAEYRRF